MPTKIIPHLDEEAKRPIPLFRRTNLVGGDYYSLFDLSPLPFPSLSGMLLCWPNYGDLKIHVRFKSVKTS